MNSVEQRKLSMSAIERTLAGLPGIREYKEKELRRAADRQVRDTLARLLEDQRNQLSMLQLNLVQRGKLEWVDDLEQAVGKLQWLMDQVKTAAYGYAGFFDANKIRESELEALVRFDQEMVSQVNELQEKISSIEQTASTQEDIGQAVQDLIHLLAELNQRWRHRDEAMRSAAE